MKSARIDAQRWVASVDGFVEHISFTDGTVYLLAADSDGHWTAYAFDAKP